MPTDFFDTLCAVNTRIPDDILSLYSGEYTHKHDDCTHLTKGTFSASIFSALDAQAHGFLSNYYKVNIATPETLALYVRAWQYEALVQTILHAKQHSLAYAPCFTEIDCLQKLQVLHELLQRGQASTHVLDEQCKALLRSIPCTTEQAISKNAEAFLAIRHDDVYGVISVETSGTSSVSKRIYCSKQDLQRTSDFFVYGMQYLLRKGENRVALLMSGLRQGSVGHLMKDAMDRLGVDCAVFGFPVDIGETAALLVGYQPTCIIGIPSHVFALSSHPLSVQYADSVDSVLLSGDSSVQSLRQHIARQFSCEVFDHYGLTETGLGGAVECRQHAGLHIRQLDMYVEILDESGHAVPDGLWGEIVITTLSRQAMPLIRYKTGDAGRRIAALCACGAVMQRLELTGRIQQSLTLAMNRRVHITELKEFFYAYQWINDVDLCIISDTEEAYSCLLIGICAIVLNKKLLYTCANTCAATCVDLQVVTKDFAQTFGMFPCEKNASPTKVLTALANTDIERFCICSMEAYQNILACAKKDASAKKDAMSMEAESSALEARNTPNPKKYIRHIHVQNGRKQIADIAK